MDFSSVRPLVVPDIGPDFEFSGGEHNGTLLFYLTYFEMVAVAPIVIPLSGRQAIMTTTDLEIVLHEQQFVQPVFAGPRLEIAEAGVNDEFLADHVALPTYVMANDQQPGSWALACSGSVSDQLSLSGEHSVMLTLRDALPAPRPDVPLHEILDFRARYADDFARLKHEIEMLMVRVGAGTEPAQAARLLANELAFSVRDVVAAFDRERVPWARVGLSASFQVPGDALAKLGGLLASVAGVPIMLGQAAAGALQLATKRSRIPRATNSLPRNFELVLHGLRENMLAAHPQSEQLFEYDYRNVLIANYSCHTGFPTREARRVRVHNSAFTNCTVN